MKPQKVEFAAACFGLLDKLQMCEENAFDRLERKDTFVSAHSNAQSTVAGLENALQKIGFGLADLPFGASDEEFAAANGTEIELLKKAIAIRFRNRPVTVFSAQLDAEYGRRQTTNDVTLEIAIEGHGHGADARQFYCIGFRKAKRFVLFGQKVYKIRRFTI